MTVEQILQSGEQHQQQRRFADAEALYRQALAVHPEHPGVLHALGMLAARCARPQIAIDLIRRALQRGSNPAFQCDLAQILSETGRSSESIAEYRRVVELDPNC